MKAYCVRRRVHAIDEMLIYAETAEDAKEKARKGDYEVTERLPSETYGGFESVRRWPDEDPE